MDPHGYHALSCIRGAGNGTYTCHNGIASDVVALGESAGVKGILNAKDGHTFGFSARTNRIKDYRPGDFYLPDFSMCGDTAMVSPLSMPKSNLAAVKYPGHLIDSKEKEKHTLYDEVISLHAKSFKTFVVDTAGLINKEALDVLYLFSTVYSRTRGVPFGHAHSIVTRRASFFIMKRIALQIHAYGVFMMSQTSM
jgi:hypothetical protein